MIEKKPASKRKPRTTADTPAMKKSAVARKATSKRASAVAFSATDAEVARKAYELWEDRGRPFGSPDEDWKNALAQLRPN